MKKFIHHYGFLLLVVGAILLLDQLTKILVRSQIEPMHTLGPWNLLGVDLYLVHMPNTGMMMGLLQGAGLVITIIGLVVSGIIIYYFPQVPPHNLVARLGMGLLLGGILGNLIDRIFVGYITDFILIGSLPVFNLADICVYAGVSLLAISVLKDARKKSPDHPEIADQS